jgi:hypothetical protein
MALRFRNRMAVDQRKDAALELMMQARAILDGDGDTVVSVSEHACSDPGCCGPQTIILVLRSDQPTQLAKINKSIEAVTQADLSDALASVARRRSSSRAHGGAE